MMGILKHDCRPIHDRSTGHDDHGGQRDHDRHDMPVMRGTMLAIAIALALVVGVFQLPTATLVERAIDTQHVGNLMIVKDHTSNLIKDHTSNLIKDHTSNLMIDKVHTIALSDSSRA
jgi:hypothetical protein